MFGVRRLFGAAPAKEEPEFEKAVELISLPAGRLNLIRPKHVTKVEKECIFLEAGLIIRRTPRPFHYQVVITRLGEDDEESSETEDTLDDDHEKAFLLEEALDFRVYETVDESDEEERPTMAFSWLDLTSPGLSERFEFVISSQHENCSAPEIERVQDAIMQCIWEGENGKDSSEAPDEDLLAIRQGFNLPYPQPEITYPVQPSNLLRAPSTPPSDESDVEHSTDTTLDYSQTSRVFRPPSLQSEQSDVENSLETQSNLGTNVEEQDGDDDSDSSADEIVNQLMGTTLADKPKDPPSRANSQPSAPSPQRKPGPSFVTDQVSPAKVQSPSPSSQRSPSVETTSSRHSSRSQESIADEDVQIAPHNPTSPSDEALADSSSFDDGHRDLQADQDPHSISMTDDRSMTFTGETVVAWESICNLYLFKADEARFDRWETGALAELYVSAPDNPQSDICWLTVKQPGAKVNDERVVISTPIGSEQNLSFSGGNILFHYKYGEADYRTWALRFPGDEVSRDQYTAAQEAFAKALYDRDNGLGSYEAQDRATKEWSRLTYGVPVDGDCYEEDDAQSDDTEEEVEDSEEEEEYASSDDDDDAQLQRFRSLNSTKNSCHALGAKENLSCVIRGNMMGIFRNESTSDKKLKFIASIPDLTTLDGTRAVHPTKIMLYMQDDIVIIKDRSIPNYLFKLDLGVGKIVEEWELNDDPLTDFFALNKFSAMENESTLIGTSRNEFFKIDPRVNGRKAVDKQTQTYKTNVDFSCGVTSASGFIALGSDTGMIRLFDPNIGKKAKTLLPEVRDAIKHLDVTNNGRYLVATCEKYLLLYDCQMKSGKLGFEKSFPKAEKPAGIRIELTPEHRGRIIHEKIPYCFNQAKFNQGDGEVERKIITAMGPYIIEFDLKSILDKSRRTQYVLKRYQERVVADNFRWGDAKEIVVTLESDVLMEKHNRLLKPSRQSIVGLEPIQPSSSRIRTGGSTLGIVQEWEG
ncbi:hypothetical protein PtA15_4A134 [Puccinia triticina]|uniref:Vacuolar import/degradation Vid27 C-terminal domain-containing protein n=1 Tax=Puccinia triticina TaxID=208348 RepID=A0ABY7CEQ2_9BASI|nr:uncharacterized protein PtA15_4A134 [Puccinia triticina]WAQ83686.1 hypothetical protein PtA15_4A134 [Puccinia triticina]